MKVREFMSTNPLTIDPDDVLEEVLQLMSQKDVWSPVVYRRYVRGFITERDIVSRVVVGGLSLKAKVRDVMRPRFGVIRPDDSYVEAARAMMSVKSRLVVLEGDDLVGVVTASDIVRAYATSVVTSPPVSRFATLRVEAVPAEMSISEVARIMSRKRVGSLLVKEGERINGIVTERDMVRDVLIGGVDLTSPVREVAKSPVLTMEVESPLREIAKFMSNNRIKRVPLRRGDEIVGIITARDIVEAIWRMSLYDELTP